MRKALIIANQYPPMGGSGVQRSCKFVKYLHEFGYEPVVLTREMNHGLMDNSLFDDLPDHKIYRTKAYDLTEWPGPLSLVGKAISRKLLIPDGDYFWSVASFEKAIEIVEKDDIDIIYTTSYPYSSHLLGEKLKRRFPTVPWVVDFRDEWTKNPYIIDMKYPRFRMRRERRMESKVAGHCSGFITNTSFMLDNFLKDYPDLAEKSTVIPNGYDDTDFASFNKAYHYGSAFTLTYTGAMYGRRKPDKVFEAVRKLIDMGSIDPKRFRIRLIGGLDRDKIDGFIEEQKLGDIVTLHGYMPHKEAIDMMIQADVLLLLIGKGRGAMNFASGKIFEYINCNRPILAVVPEVGAAANIIRETRSGIVCETSSVDAIAEGILELYQRWENKDLVREPDWEAIGKYHRRELTRQLASAFDSLL